LESGSKRMSALDLFCGVGGLSLGFESAGIQVAAALDSNPLVLSTYSRNFPGVPIHLVDLADTDPGAFRRVLGIRQGQLDVVFGGPPCQGFSVGGLHRPDDPRNRLVVRFAEWVVAMRPRFFVFENVKGLLQPCHRPLLDEAISVLRKAGYDIVEPVRALNAAAFGVPQRRERVFVLGSRDRTIKLCYPEASSERVTVWDAIGDLAIVDEREPERESDDYLGPLGAATRYTRALRGPAGVAGQYRMTGFGKTEHSPAVARRFARLGPGERDPISRFLRLDELGLCPTLRSGTGPDRGSFMAPRPVHPRLPRCIYPREAARLHSFPDWFQFHGTRWHDFMAIGNSVPPILGRAVATEIARYGQA
jgi:DNA (cytosine-5)-methyltransferase 1